MITMKISKIITNKIMISINSLTTKKDFKMKRKILIQNNIQTLKIWKIIKNKIRFIMKNKIKNIMKNKIRIIMKNKIRNIMKIKIKKINSDKKQEITRIKKMSKKTNLLQINIRMKTNKMTKKRSTNTKTNKTEILMVPIQIKINAKNDRPNNCEC